MLFGPATRDTARLLLPQLEKLKAQFHTPDLMATQTAVLAAPTIFDSGQEVYPLGGYNGTGASPSLGQLKSLIADGTFHIVLSSPTSKDPRYRWIAEHCRAVGAKRAFAGFGIYFCGSVRQ
jgi:hypothetical protein